MGFQISPGVTITERDLTTIIPAVATTNAGIAGYFQWGPADQRVIVTDVANLAALYGTPNDSNYKYWFSAANFLGYGNNLQVVRVTSANATNAGQTGAQGYIPNSDADLPNFSTNSGMFCAKYPGNLGNSLAVEICGADAGSTAFAAWTYGTQFDSAPNTSYYAATTLGLSNANDEFHLVVLDRLGQFSGAINTVLERFQGLSLDPNANLQDGTSIYFKTKINKESKYLAAVGSITNFSAAPFVAGGMTGSGLTVATYSGVGTWSFDSTKTDASRYTTGSYTGLTAAGVFRLELQGGTGEFDSGATNLFATGYGYDKFSDADQSDVSLLIGGPCTAGNVGNLVGIVNARKDCVAFVSPENNNASTAEATKLSTAQTFRNAVGNSSYTVIDTGYKYQYDSYNDTYRYVPLNGDIAGLCARTDSTNDPWWSPAGFNRGVIRNAVRLAYNPSKTHRDTLYQNGINPVITMAGEGTLLFGDKTAQTKPSAFDRINVRRLFIVLEKAIATAAKYSLFEFNDAFTRAQFRSMVEPFLRDVQSRRGITDFLVKCDESNNTAEVIDGNRFVADIYIKPARSINFIQLNFIATKTGVSFTEVGG
jgi:Phage tail sheath protein subtilisin-like domain/Phage tail sheath C-terminal domain